MNTKQEIITPANKSEAKVWRWLHGSKSNDSARTVLLATHCNATEVATANGSQLAIAPKAALPSLSEYENVNIYHDVMQQKRGPLPTVTPRPYHVTLEDGDSFPEYTQIIPVDEPILRIGLDRDMLIAMIKDMPAESNHLVFEFHGDSSPVVIKSTDEDGHEYTGIIMPRYLKD